MASPVADSYSVASGAPVWAGRFPSGLLSGGAVLGDVSASGGMASAASVLSGGATLDDVAASGGMVGRTPSSLEAFITAATPGTITEFTGTNIGTTETSNYNGDALGIFESYFNLPITAAWHGQGTYDSSKRRLSLVGTSQGFSSFSPAGERSKAIHFDMDANAFSVQWNPTGKNEAHIYQGNASRPINGYMYRRAFNHATFKRMDTTSKVWSDSYVSTAWMSPLQSVPTVEVFPDLGPSGALCVFGSNGEVWTIDLATDVVTLRDTVADVNAYCVALYCAAEQCIVFGGGTTGTAMYRLEADGTVNSITQTFPTDVRPSCNNSSTVAHPDGTGIVTISEVAHQGWYMNAATGTWTKLMDFVSPFYGQELASCAICLHDLGAIALWRGNSSIYSHFYVWKL